MNQNLDGHGIDVLLAHLTPLGYSGSLEELTASVQRASTVSEEHSFWLALGIGPEHPLRDWLKALTAHFADVTYQSQDWPARGTTAFNVRKSSGRNRAVTAVLVTIEEERQGRGLEVWARYYVRDVLRRQRLSYLPSRSQA